jgi:hypothetical protein
MTDSALKSRNEKMITELWPALRPKVKAILEDMKGHGFRPRIQVAYRTLAQQLATVASGNSWVTWSYHMAKNSDGSKGALAADIIDDDLLYNSSRFFELLEKSAKSHGLETGRGWRKKDPAHVQYPESIITLSRAKKGARP